MVSDPRGVADFKSIEPTPPRRPPRLEVAASPPAAERPERTFRDLVVEQLLCMTGAADNTVPHSPERVNEILGLDPGPITYQDFNELLMYLGLGPVSSAFFDYFFGGGFQTIDSLREGVRKVRTYSFLFHGNFVRGFEELRMETDPENLARPAWDLQTKSASRTIVDRIEPLTAAESHATGYLTETSSLTKRQRAAALTRGTANAERYMAMNGVDIYVGGSMRSKQDFADAEALIRAVRNHTGVKSLGLTFFNPLWAYVPDAQQKGLLEVLMLKKASAMLFIAGAQDSFGKDSELASMLVQGKPAVVYAAEAPTDDPRAGDFDKHFRMFYENHPLAMQCDLKTGVANGVLVTRSPEVCAELLSRLFSNTMEFDIDDSDQYNHYLRERITGSRVRVVTRNKLLTDSFWQQYLGNDPRRPPH